MLESLTVNAKKNSRLSSAVILPATLILVTVVYLIEAIRNVRPLEEGTAGPSFFPIVVSVVMLAALLPLLWSGWRKTAPSEEKTDEKEPVSMAAPVKVVLLTAAYIALFKPVGYFISSALYVLALLYVFRFKGRHPLMNVFWAVVIAGLCFVLFSEIFQIRLPKLGEII